MKKQFLTVALLLLILCPCLISRAADYGLPEKIEEGNILHCFSWPIKNIREELPNIAAAGFGAIQISPMQRPDINEGWTWYTIYLPYDYHAYSSPGMGNREDLRSLCEEAEQYGIKIIVDVVLNHVNKGEPYYNPWWKSKKDYYRTWGSEGKSINYNSRYSITHDPLGDYVEIETANDQVIGRAKAYIEELKELGVKGIRYDAAKHIELPNEEGGGSQIWPQVTGVKDLFHYGEVVGDCKNGDDSQISEYTKYLWVPNNAYSTYAARENGGIPNAGGGNRDKPTNGHLIYWAESHDDYSNDEWSELKDQGVIDRAYCALACRNTQAALYYSRPRARGKENIKIEKGSTSFMSKQVVEVNKFRNAMKGKADHFSYNGSDAASITRQNGGAVIVIKGSNQYVSIANGGSYCPSGTYKDRVSGNTFTVNASTISGTVGPTGVAIIYADEDYKNTPTPEAVTVTGNKQYNVAYAGNFSNGNNYIYYFKGNSSPLTWPGVKMERALGSDGKYYWCYNVPAGYDKVIFNNGTGSDAMQTGDLQHVSNFIMDNGGATITPVSFKTGPFTPEPTPVKTKQIAIEEDYNVAYSGEYKYIHYWGGVSASDWPGVKTKEAIADDGNVYRCFKVPAGTTHVIFNNGETSDDTKQQTADLAYSNSKVMCETGATEVKVIFSYQGGNDDLDPTPSNPEPEALEVVWPNSKYCYFYNSYNWTPKVWAWISASNKTNCGSVKDWPGDGMSETADKYFWQASNNSVGMLIISNKGSDRAGAGDGDLKFVNGATYYPDGGHIGGDDNTSTNPKTLYLLGTIKDHTWDTSYELELQKIDDKGIYIAQNVPLTELEDAYFSFTTATGSSWDDLNSKAVRFGAPYENTPIRANSPTHVVRYAGDDTGGSQAWRIEKGGNYDIVVDLYDMTVTILDHPESPNVSAEQLVEVQKSTANSPINSYDYLTYPVINGKAKGVKVNGDNITLTEVSITDDFYFKSSNVLFTEKVLVTTSFNGIQGYNLDPQTASIGKKQTDGQFRGIISLENLGSFSIGSKVNYYYTIHEGVDVKVPMQTSAGIATVKLAVPEPLFIKSDISVESSEEPSNFTYGGSNFMANYNIVKANIKIEDSNMTPGLSAVAGDVYKVKIGDKYVTENDNESDIISAAQLFDSDYNGPEIELVTYVKGVQGIERWQPTGTNAATSFSMSVDAPSINSCRVREYHGDFEPVLVNGKSEDHFIVTTKLALDVNTTRNFIKAYNSDNQTLSEIELAHSSENDWYLVEFYDKTGKKLASNVVEGMNGERNFEVRIDYGIGYEDQIKDLLTSRWYEEATVHVSALYPFAIPASTASLSSRRRTQGSYFSPSIVESEAHVADVSVPDDVVTGIESIGIGNSESIQYYNTQGIRVTRPDTPGVYVIRDSNGTTRKIIVR